MNVNARPAASAPATAATTTPVATDLSALKTAASAFAVQLEMIKTQVAELEQYGRIPPTALMDAIGQGDQLTATIASANTLADLGETDPAGKLQKIGATIAANSKF
jgi:hypothetical protein